LHVLSAAPLLSVKPGVAELSGLLVNTASRPSGDQRFESPRPLGLYITII